MIKDNHKKIADQVEFEVIREKDKDKGIVVGKAYDFLFEGENNEYDEEYADYI
jgi:hypothetical protein